MSIRQLIRTFGRSMTVCCTVGWAAVYGAVPADQLLPATTKGAVFIPNWDKLEAAFDSTQLGQLIQDPVMQPFIADLKQQINDKGNRRLEKLGVTLDDLKQLPGGEIAVAVTLPDASTAGSLVIIDVTGHEEQAQALRTRIGKNLTAQGGQLLPAEDGISRYQLPRQTGETVGRTTANLLKKQTLILSDNVQLVRDVARALDTPRTDSLSTLPAYKAIQTRLADKSSGLQPHVRWFLEPFGYTDATRIYDPPSADKAKGPDMLKLLRNQGFAAVQGIGGLVNFSTGQHELLHRTFVYAPGNPGAAAGERFSLGARLLDFPATKDLHIQSWIPREIATYSTFNWNLRERFGAAETLVDEYIGQKGGFRDILDSIEKEPKGPKVSIEKEIIDNLSHRFSVVTDYQMPITPKSERLVFAIEIDTKKNNQPEQAVARAIEQMMGSDDRVRKVEHNGLVIWENIPDKETALVPDFEIEIEGAAITTQPTAYQAPKAAPGRRGRPGINNKPGQAEEKEKKTFPNQAVTVAHGHLYIASHTDILVKVLNHVSQVKAQQAGIIAVGRSSPSLDSSTDVMMVLLEMEQGFKAEAICFRHFSRTDEEFRPTYELIRNGQMPNSETLFGKMLNGIFGDGKPGTTRAQKIDNSKNTMPEFDVVRRYLGPAGAFATDEGDGWLLTGFTLRKTVTSAKMLNGVQR